MQPAERDVCFDHVTYRYPGAAGPALRDLSFEIERGQIVLVTGPPGSGKSTFCQALNGMVPHSYGGDFHGSVVVRGRDTRECGVGGLAFVAGLLPEHPDGRFICPTVDAEVGFGPANRGIPPDEVERLTRVLLERTGLGGLMGRSPRTLSAGHKQAVAFASVVAMEPDVFVLDGPSSGLDPFLAGMAYSTVRRIVAESGRTAIIAGHDLERLAPLVDRLVVLDEGSVVYEGSVRYVASNGSSLAHLGIRTPRVAELASRLRAKGLTPGGPPPVTVEEALAAIRPAAARIPPEARRAAMAAASRGRMRKRRMAGDTVVEASRLRHRYPNGVEGLKGVDLSVGRGEFVGIVGRNGSGKSTLAKHFNGLLMPSSGWVSAFGVDTRGTSASSLFTRIGYCFESPGDRFFSRTVREEIAFGPRNLGFSNEAAAGTADRVAAQLGLAGVLDVNPRVLGKSHRQRVGIASVLAMGPEVLIVDGLTTGQDPVSSKGIMDLLRGLNEDVGKTVVIIDHDMDLIAEYCDRVVVLEDGRVLLDGPPEEVFSREAELTAIGLEVPAISRLMRALGFEGDAVLSVEEAAHILEETLGVA